MQTTAISEYVEALKRDPSNTELACDLADRLLEAGRCSQAKMVFEHALEYDSRLLRAWYGAGCADTERAEFATARQSFARAVDLAPDWLQARHNLGRALYELGHVDEAFDEFRRCAELDVEGSEYSRAMMAVIAPGVPKLDQAGILAIRKWWAQSAFGASKTRVRKGHPGGMLRVGYLSSFFQRDNWMKPVWGLLNSHDRSRVEVALFSDCPRSEIQHGYVAHSSDRYFDISHSSNEEVRDLVNGCGMDILVDLNGYSNMRRLPLFAEALNVVTVGWFNMYATTGMSGFDYLIGDECVVERDEDEFYCEKVLRVSGSYLPFRVSYPVPPVAVRPGGPRPLVFGSLASQYKITDQVIEAWSQILLGCAGSLLLVKNKQLASASGREYLQSRFSRFGIGAERLCLEGPEEHFEFLKAYDRMDVALDTFPYNGGTTTSEAIWQGVPVLTFCGDRWASRTSASILRAAGLGRFVARDQRGFVELGIEMGNRPGIVEELAALRFGMRDSLMATAVCDVDGFARAMEEIYFGVV